MKTLIIGLKEKARLYESTNLACDIWQQIDGNIKISTSSHDRQDSGIVGAIANNLMSAPNTPRKIVCEIAHEQFQDPKDIANKIVQKMQTLGWDIAINREEA